VNALPNRRVLLLVASLGNGGLERQLTLLATNLPPEWRPLVWSAEGGPFRDVLERAGVPVMVDDRRGRLDPLPFAALVWLIARHRPDVVHAWHWLPAAVAAPACRMAGVPFIDGTIRLGRPQRAFGRPRASIMRLANIVVANSQAGLDAWGVRPPRGRVVYNAFDPARLALTSGDDKVARDDEPAGGNRAAPPAVPKGPAAAGPFTVVMTSRMHPHKDYRTVVAAARLLAQGSPSGAWRFLLVGDGPERAALQNEARDLVEAGVVDFVAPGLEVIPVVAHADAGVLMTNDAVHAEGCSNSIMEYMACGLPVVCADSGGNRELVTDGVTGFLVAAGDAPALAGRLLELRTSGRARTMGVAGRERLLCDFTVARMVSAYTTLYDECASLKRRPAAAAGQDYPAHR
jgi:glycosyltransferase involved in cell wall biosynthesis